MAKLYTMASSLNCVETSEVFNKQNQKILSIFKKHMEIHENGSGEYLPIIKELIDYMTKTFHEENMVMMNAHYPDFLEHARAHQKFTRKIEEFLKSYEQEDKDLGFKIFIFLKDWIRDHTSKLDVECAEYMRKNAFDQKEANGDEKIIGNHLFAYSLRT